jgi:enoyl-CoA hydratase/carnithine racemase
VLDFADQTVLIGAGMAALIVVLLVVIIAMFVSRRQHVSDEQQVARLRRKRVARYEDAQRDYDKFRKKVETSNTLLIEFIHDLGDEFIGRDSAQQQIVFDEAFEAVASIRQANPRSKIVIVLHTLGGYARPAHMIALALKQHLKKAKAHNSRRDPHVIAYVPYVAMSGGAMIALAAEKVVMDPTASLGPIDTIYGGFPTETYRDLLEQKGPLATQDVLVMLAHEAEKYDRYADRIAREIVHPNHKAEDRDPDFLARYLSSGELSHSEAISPGEAEKLGMNVSTKIPQEIYGLVDARIRMIHTRLEYEERRTANPDPAAGEGEDAEKSIERVIRESLRGGIRL